MTKVSDDLPGKENQEFDEAAIKAKLIAEHNQKTVQQSGFPTEIVDLPSKGLLYSKSSPLSTGQIEMKYMTAREEDILTSQNLIKKGVVLDKLFQSLIVTPINYDDLLVGDKNTIMVAARILGYGKDYKTTLKCPECGHEHKATIDLTRLKDVELDESLIKDGNRFEYKLPASGRVVTFKLLTHGDEKRIASELKALADKASRTSVTPEITNRLSHIITSVDGITEPHAIREFVQTQLLARDSRDLRKYIAEIVPTTKFTHEFVCDNCEHTEEELAIPIDINFFWPRA